MRIAYDGRPFSFNWIEGMLVYNKELMKQFFSHYPDHEYLFFFNSLKHRFDTISLLQNRQNVSRVVMPIPTVGRDRIDLKLFFDIGLPFYMKRHRIDLFHGLRYFVPPSKSVKVVTTFHDLFALTIPQFSPEASNRSRTAWYARAAERSTMIISASQATKNDLMRFYDVPDWRIRVVPLAPASNFSPVTDTDRRQEIKSKYHLDFPYIMALGGPHPRKNLERVIMAFARFIGKGGSRHRLIFFGGSAGLLQLWAPLIHRLKLDDLVQFICPVPDEDLPGMYSLADLFVYPSLYEGFGIPVVEAMSCGTPVITSTISSMPEVAGGAAVLVDPASVEELSEAMFHILDDQELRCGLIEKGLRRASYFSWEKTARMTMDVYQEALAM